MQIDNLLIEIDGGEVPELKCDLISLEIELDDELAGMFRMTVGLLLQENGSWTYLDDDRFRIWRKVAITAGLKDDSQRLLTGYITHVRPEFGLGMEQCRLEVWGMDASVQMDRIEVLKTWPNMKDSDIAAQLFTNAGLTPQVTDTTVVHDENVSTIVQRETDIRLLKRLALRNGFECFVDGSTGRFQPPASDSSAQPVLAVHAGDQTNVNQFKLEVNALSPANVAMSEIDHGTGEVLTATAQSGHQPALGASLPADFLPAGIAPGQLSIGQTVATGAPEMAILCQALFDQGEWFVTGEGEVAANQYGSILMPRRTVIINGVGETHSGAYYVTHVTHRFTEDGYTQLFRVKRNALVSSGPGGGGLSAGTVGAP